MKATRSRRSALVAVLSAGVTLVSVTSCTPDSEPKPSVEAPEHGMIPVGDADGDHAGWMRESDLAEAQGDPGVEIPVYDDDGEQVGIYRVGEDGGFEPDR